MKPRRHAAAPYSSRPPVEAHDTLTLPSGSGRLVVVSDTHSEPHPAIGERIAALAPTALLHCGDIGNLGVLEQLAALAGVPVLAVRGNIDERARDIPDVLIVDVARPPGTPLRLYVTHIAVHGPKLRAEVAKRARDAGAQLVVCGHSHVPFIGVDRGLPIFNPGSIGPRRFRLPIVFGVIEIGPSSVKLGHFDCATGQPWSPP